MARPKFCVVGLCLLLSFYGCVSATDFLGLFFSQSLGSFKFGTITPPSTTVNYLPSNSAPTSFSAGFAYHTGQQKYLFTAPSLVNGNGDKQILVEVNPTTGDQTTLSTLSGDIGVVSLTYNSRTDKLYGFLNDGTFPATNWRYAA
jgi:hypothetical protein